MKFLALGALFLSLVSCSRGSKLEVDTRPAQPQTDPGNLPQTSNPKPATDEAHSSERVAYVRAMLVRMMETEKQTKVAELEMAGRSNQTQRVTVIFEVLKENIRTRAANSTNELMDYTVNELLKIDAAVEAERKQD